jgi:hypothetical protein
MKNINIPFLLLLLILLGSSFYWFQIRPANIRSYCNWSVRWGPDKPNYLTREVYDFLYKSCLRSKGISN